MGGTHFRHKTENLSDFNGIHCHVVPFRSFSSTINFNRCAWLIRVRLWHRSKYLFSWSQWVPLLRITFWLLLAFCINILFAFQLTHDEWEKSLTTEAKFQMRSTSMGFMQNEIRRYLSSTTTSIRKTLGCNTVNARKNHYPAIWSRGWSSGGARGAMAPPAGAKCPKFWAKCPPNLGKMPPFAPMCPPEFGQNALHLSPKCPGFVLEWPKMHHLGGNFSKFSKFSGGGPPDPPKYSVKTTDLPLAH